MMLYNEKQQNEIDEQETPEIDNLFDYDDQRITTIWQQIIDKRRKELSIEKVNKAKYRDDIKRVNFLKFLKRNKNVEKLNLSEEQFDSI